MSDTILDRDETLGSLDGEALTMAVAELFENHGWETKIALGSGSGDTDRVATRSGRRYLLRTVPRGDGPLTAAGVTSAADAHEQTDTVALLLVVVGDLTDDARERAVVDDSITLFDVESAESLAHRLGEFAPLQEATPAESPSTSSAMEQETGASPAAVEAAVADLGESMDETESGTADPSDDTDEDAESSTRGASDETISATVRGAERRMVVAEFFLQGLLVLGLLACFAFVTVRLGQVLL
jgi:hypothetical protein